jgi:predicted O-methyltransferase YrrM
MNTLDMPPAGPLLAELYAAAEANDKAVLSALRGTGRTEDPAVLDHAYIAVEPDVGRLLYLLTRLRKPALAVEFGASHGLSAIHIGAALRDNGSGRLITTEVNAGKAAKAAANLKRAGLDDLVELRQGDAFQTLKGVTGIEMVLLDGWKPLYLPMLQALEPALAPGALIVADDIGIFAEALAPYLAYVRAPANGCVSCAVASGDGVEITVR